MLISAFKYASRGFGLLIPQVYVARVPAGALEATLVEARSWVAFQLNHERQFWNHWRLQGSCGRNWEVSTDQLDGLSLWNSPRLLCLMSFQILARHIAFWESILASWIVPDVWTRPGDVSCSGAFSKCSHEPLTNLSRVNETQIQPMIVRGQAESLHCLHLLMHCF